MQQWCAPLALFLLINFVVKQLCKFSFFFTVHKLCGTHCADMSRVAQAPLMLRCSRSRLQVVEIAFAVYLFHRVDSRHRLAIRYYCSQLCKVSM